MQRKILADSALHPDQEFLSCIVVMRIRHLLQCCAPVLLGNPILLSLCHAITIELQRPSDQPEAFFFQANHWSPFFTELNVLELSGTLSDERVSFLLLRVNDKLFPLEPDEGQFNTRIQLDPGPNHIQVESNLRHLQTAEQTVYRVEPARLLEVKEQVMGGAASSVNWQHSEKDQPEVTRVQLRSPMIQVTGIRGTEPVVELKVKDPYNNTLPVELIGDREFTVAYTARERSTYLDFISSLNNRELRRERLQLELEGLIQLAPSTPENPDGWSLWNPKTNTARVQLDTFTLAGSLFAVSEGEVEIVMGVDVMKVPVVNHQFEAQLPLRHNQLNRGRVRVTLNNQSFFESFQIEQREPVVNVGGLQRFQIDGSVLVPETPLEVRPGSTLRLPRGVLRLFGNAQFEGNLRLVLERSPDGTSIVISESTGPFEIHIPLEPGEAGYHLLLEGGGFSRPYYSFHAEVQEAIKVDAVNYLPYRSGLIELTRPELLLRGRVMGVQRGLMQLDLGDVVQSIPVLQERFEMDQALPVPEGCDHFKLSLQAGELTLEKQFEIQLAGEDPVVPATTVPSESPAAPESEAVDGAPETPATADT